MNHSKNLFLSALDKAKYLQENLTITAQDQMGVLVPFHRSIYLAGKLALEKLIETVSAQSEEALEQAIKNIIIGVIILRYPGDDNPPPLIQGSSVDAPPHNKAGFRPLLGGSWRADSPEFQASLKELGAKVSRGEWLLAPWLLNNLKKSPNLILQTYVLDPSVLKATSKTEALVVFKAELNKITSIPELLTLFAEIKNFSTGRYAIVHQSKNLVMDKFLLFFKQQSNIEEKMWHTKTYQSMVKAIKEKYLLLKKQQPNAPLTPGEESLVDYRRGNKPLQNWFNTHTRKVLKSQQLNPPKK